MDLKALFKQLEAFADGFCNAPHLRARVHYAEHIYDAWEEINEEMERVFNGKKTEASSASAQTSLEIVELPLNHRGEVKVIKPLRFRKMTLAEVGKAILREHGQLHGKKIEEMAIGGGYRSTAQHFQSSMAVAFKRDGGFENVGGNVWRLKATPSEVVPISSNGTVHQS